MNQIKISGFLRKDNEDMTEGMNDKYFRWFDALRAGIKKRCMGYIYWLDVKRTSGTIDTLLVLSRNPGLIEGTVCITGYLKSAYTGFAGVPVYIVPEQAEKIITGDISDAAVSGTLKPVTEYKKTPQCRYTKNGTPVVSILLVTDNGTVPVLLWDKNAKYASRNFKAGDRLMASGRMQSREYEDKNGNVHITYELSAKNIEPYEEPE